MLAFRLALADLAGPWRWQTDRWVAGASWITPFSNPALEAALLQHPRGRVCCVIRERRTGHRLPRSDPPTVAADIDKTLAELAGWPGEYLLLDAEPDRVRLTAGAHGTAPIYLAAPAAQVLEGSWDLLDLRGHLHPDRLLDRAVARVLTRRLRNSTDTLWPGVHRLTERATATFTPQHGLHLAYPEAVPRVVTPGTLKPDADPIGALDDLLAEVIGRLPVPHGQACIELSGGVDSGNVALSVRRQSPSARIPSYAAQLDGPVGEQQRQRRAQLVRRLGLDDVTVAVARHRPFQPAGPRSVPHDPVSLPNLEVFTAIRQALIPTGAKVVFTGFGGDENFSPRPAERAPDGALTPPGDTEMPWLGPRTRDALPAIETNLAPVPAAPLPSVIVHAARNPTFMRSGLWTICPLADPRLTVFGPALPVAWRRGKRLLRDRLRHAGFSHQVAHPPLAETFGPHVQDGLRRYGLPILRQMVTDSLLADLGYLDPAALHAAYIHHTTSTAPIPTLLYETLALETGLRSLT